MDKLRIPHRMEESNRSAGVSLNIVVGYNCNMFCAHCANHSGPGRVEGDLSRVDMERIERTIKSSKVEEILFSGGEPTLYLDQISEITRYCTDLEQVRISIITNGLFAKSQSATDDVLGQMLKLDNIQMSYDRFHAGRAAIDQAKLIKLYADRKGINFGVSMAIASPEEIALASEVIKLGIDVQFQKVIDCGRARNNRVFFFYDSFEETVIKSKCPSAGRISYLPGRGFSTCCSSLVFNEVSGSFIHSKLDEHIESPFYKLVSRNTFEQIAERANVNVHSLPPEFSSECKLCEYIFINGTGLD